MIFRDAGEYNMTGEGHVWIVTEQALHANNTPDGVLGLQLEHAHSDKGHIRVSQVGEGSHSLTIHDSSLAGQRLCAGLGHQGNDFERDHRRGAQGLRRFGGQLGVR